jgi:hypothetical protein
MGRRGVPIFRALHRLECACRKAGFGRDLGELSRTESEGGRDMGAPPPTDSQVKNLSGRRPSRARSSGSTNRTIRCPALDSEAAGLKLGAPIPNRYLGRPGRKQVSRERRRLYLHPE